MMRPARVLDVVLAIALTAAGAKIGADHYAATTSLTFRPQFYQVAFGQAVMQACGRGFVNPAPDAVAALDQFLNQKRTTFDCAELPATVRLEPRTLFQGAFRYLILAVALYWRATGVSWDHLAPVFGALHGLVVGFSYLAFRAVLARTLAVPLALAIALSPAGLAILPYLRDSTKAPFFMADAAIVLLVWTRPLTTRTVVVLCGLFGLVAGIGVGFRPDVVVWFPALAIALFCAPHAGWRQRLRATALGLCVSVGTFVVCGWPILARYGSGSNFGHVAILGFGQPFDATLGVQGGPYARGYYYQDAYVTIVVNSYAKRVHRFPGELAMAHPGYERYASLYFWEMVRTFPADVVTRLEASVINVLNLAVHRSPYESDFGVSRVPYLQAAVHVRNRILWPLDGLGPYIVLGAFALLAARGFAIAGGFALTVLYLAGLPVLQFHFRHFSHLEFLTLLTAGIVIQVTAGAIRNAATRRPRDRAAWRSFGLALARVAVCVGALLVVPLVVVGLLRSRQQDALTRLIDGYNAAAAELPYSTEPAEPDRVLVVPEGIPVHDRVRTGKRPWMEDDYLAVDLSDACDAMSLTMRMRYESDNIAFANLTRDAAVKLWPTREYGSVRVFVPVYQFIDGNKPPTQGVRFKGLEFATRDLPCLAGLKRVPKSANAPLWLDLSLSRSWRRQPLYQTLADTAEVDSADPQIYSSSPALVLKSRAVDGLSGVARDVYSMAKVATVDYSTGVMVDGIAESPTAYLVGGKPRTVTAGTQLVGVGELFRGGFTFGVQKDNAWSQYFNVTKPGRFVAAVEVPTDGTYVAVIANVNPDTTKPTRFVITGMDWIVR